MSERAHSRSSSYAEQERRKQQEEARRKQEQQAAGREGRAELAVERRGEVLDQDSQLGKAQDNATADAKRRAVGQVALGPTAAMPQTAQQARQQRLAQAALSQTVAQPQTAPQTSQQAQRSQQP